MKVLLDMNLSPRWVGILNRSQVKAVHWSTIGRAEATDTDVMAYAAQHGYVMLTQDLDLSAILAATRGAKPSVVQIRSNNLDPNVIGAQVVSALGQFENELNSGAVVSVHPRRTRVRLLPLKRKT